MLPGSSTKLLNVQDYRLNVKILGHRKWSTHSTLTCNIDFSGNEEQTEYTTNLQESIIWNAKILFTEAPFVSLSWTDLTHAGHEPPLLYYPPRKAETINRHGAEESPRAPALSPGRAGRQVGGACGSGHATGCPPVILHSATLTIIISIMNNKIKKESLVSKTMQNGIFRFQQLCNNENNGHCRADWFVERQSIIFSTTKSMKRWENVDNPQSRTNWRVILDRPHYDILQWP